MERNIQWSCSGLNIYAQTHVISREAEGTLLSIYLIEDINNKKAAPSAQS